MHSRFFKFLTLLCCCFILSCGSRPGFYPMRGPQEFEKTMHDYEKGILCGQVDSFFIGEEETNVRYTFFLTLQKLGPIANQGEAEKNQITLSLTGNYNTFSIPLPPGNYLPLHWQCNFFYVKDKTTVTQFNNWPDFTINSQLQSSEKDKAIIEDPFPQSQILIQPGKFTYIGKIKLRLPLLNTPIEFFAEKLKKEIEANPEEQKAALKYGMDYNSGWPPGMTMSNKVGFFIYTYVSDSFDEYKNDSVRSFGESTVFQKMAFENKAFNKAIIRGRGFTYKDLR